MYSVHEDVVALSVDVLAHYEKMRWLLVWMYWLIMGSEYIMPQIASKG